MASKLKDESNGEKSEATPKVCSRDNMEACAEALGRIEDGSESWEELRLIKSMAPRAACIIPASSHDFVSSALLAVGAYALLVDDKDDIESVLVNSIGVVVDVSAPKDLLNSFMEKFVPETQPVVVVATGAGCNERKLELAMKLLETCSPAAVCGRSPDLVALGEVISEKHSLTGNDLAINDEPTATDTGRSKSVPFLRTQKLHKTRSPSPGRKLRDLQKKDFSRQVTPIPALIMKGRFREGTQCNLDIASIIKHGQRIAAHVNCTVMFQDLNLLTNGELIVDINTCQVGMQNIHSTVECMAALTAIVMGIVDEKGEECTIYKCAHAACLYYTAGELAVGRATVKDCALPGSLRTHFIDILYTLEEEQVRKEGAKLSIHI